MDFKRIDAAIEDSSLLKHPFYQAWSDGKLTLDDLRYYAKQYYHMEKNFPRLISRVHAACEDPQLRKGLLENLVDEERGEENHRELWLRFAEGLGLSREEVENSAPDAATEEALSSLTKLAADPDPAVGLSALYGYESQQPSVAASKIAGLEKFYGIDDARTLQFFKVHEDLDVWHSEVEQMAIEKTGADVETVETSARSSAKALLRFLDGVHDATVAKREPAAA